MTPEVASPAPTHTPKSAKTSNADWVDRERPDTLVLFDVDGTLSPSRKCASPEMLQLLRNLKKKVVIGYVGGSDLAKQMEQLGEDAAKTLFDFSFSENGATAFKKGELIGQESLLGFMGEERYQKLINWTLRYIADLDLPVKRGTFVELRNGMVNISPIGRNCSYAERLDFSKLDDEKKIRETMVEAYRKEFAGYGLQYSIGGQISIDVFPQGWDKTYCLRHIASGGFKEIHFFGDKTEKGGNDYEIFNHPSVVGHAVKNPEDTAEQIRKLFSL
ncbi:Phosphomannomutase [Paramicrosporidium saccamoebae]|uniref:Phosphomannomutase n=1 Tax=Paramicrosporidium saccamoebae TaxID=1246581 RepID=A0A2H9TFY9_9FUNG|nr:Phosphomannomutase [Paramicrosporidium saccamoebae]